MASSNSLANKCATCIRKSDEQKVKPGIISCVGCSQSFCLLHLNEHRQMLTDTLDVISAQRDDLRSRIGELLEKLPDQHVNAIDDWEHEMLQKVKDAATNARQQVRELIIGELKRECDGLTSTIVSFQENDDYFEPDLQKLRAKTEQLDTELANSTSSGRIELKLPALDFSNMVQIKSYDAQSDPKIDETTNGNPKEEYRSFVKHFLTTHVPSIEVQTTINGKVCASPMMLIDVKNRQAERLIFNRKSKSTFQWSENYQQPNVVQWSSQLQQFIVLKSDGIVVIDAMEKEGKEVFQDTQGSLQYMACWKRLCLAADNGNRLFLFEMNKNLKPWFLKYCWSPPTSCARNEMITAIGISEHHIALAIKVRDKYNFVLHTLNMAYRSKLQLNYACSIIQSLPNREWLLHDSTQNLYYVIDAKLEQHDEPYLPSLSTSKCSITYDKDGKILLVLLSEEKLSRYNNGTVHIYDYPL